MLHLTFTGYDAGRTVCGAEKDEDGGVHAAYVAGTAIRAMRLGDRPLCPDCCEPYIRQVLDAPRYSVITELRCPCEQCCGELTDRPETEEFTELRAAVREYQSYGPDVEEGEEPSSCPLNLESAAHAWITRYGHNYGGACEDNNTAWQKSFHINGNVTPSSRLRILRLLAKQ